MGVKWGNSGHSTRDVGCGGLWQVEENGTKVGEKMREKREKNGTKYPFFKVPFPPFFFRRAKLFPTVPCVKISSPHFPTENWAFLPLTDTHRHGG